MAQWKKHNTDGSSTEIFSINGYAVFMGYLSMAIKGLGFLILTWTTVVLLGGFVSALQKKDFWCLTFITLVQTAGIFDVYMNEKLSYILYSAYGMMTSTVGYVVNLDISRIDRDDTYGILLQILRYLVAIVMLVVQALVLAILVLPSAAIYVFGLLISTGISLWRLIQHDYGGNSNEEANLKPAMDTLYSLAVLQGVLFLYRFIYARAGKRILKNLLPTRVDCNLESILSYLSETRIGCEKNPSFARGRNLITHAVDLIGSKSPDACISGIQLLYTSICIGERKMILARDNGEKELSLERWEEVIMQHVLMKNMIMTGSPSPLLEKLLQMLKPWGAHDRESRNQAARIVAYLALDIQLEQFPRALQHILTLIGSSEEYRLIEPYQRDRLIHRYDHEPSHRDRRMKRNVHDWDRRASRLPLPEPGNDEDVLHKAHEKLVLRGLCILQKLATDENNCRIMSENHGLLPRIMAPLTSDIIHKFDGISSWSVSVVEGSLKVMRLLVAAPGETGARMRQQISNNKKAVHTMERILNCPDCHFKLQKQALGILIQLYMDTKSRPTFIKMLVYIFAYGDSRDWSIRKLAGETLEKLCFQSGSNAGILLWVDDDLIGSLTKILLDAENETCRIRAAQILEHMCNTHQTQDDKSVSKHINGLQTRGLKNLMTITMPKLLAQIPCCELAKDKTHATTEADHLVIFVQDDIENQSSDHSEEVYDDYESEYSTEEELPKKPEYDENKPSSSTHSEYEEEKASSSTHPEYKEDKTASSIHPVYKEDKASSSSTHPEYKEDKAASSIHPVYKEDTASSSSIRPEYKEDKASSSSTHPVYNEDKPSSSTNPKYKDDKPSSSTHPEYWGNKASSSTHPVYKEYNTATSACPVYWMKKASSSTHPVYEKNEEEVDVEEDDFQGEEDGEIRTPLLSLCVTICDTFISADQDLARQFDNIRFPKKLKEMVQKNSLPTVRCLRLMKVTCKMVISMMKHRGSYAKEDMDSLMDALSSASESMVHLDMSTVFAAQDDRAQIMKPVRSLYSLVMEAKKSVATRTGN